MSVKKKGKKGLLCGCAVVLAAILAVGVTAGVTHGFKDWGKAKPSTKATFSEVMAGTATTILNSKATSIGPAAMVSLPIEVIDCPNVETIKKCAFAECFSLKSINFPKVRKIEDSAFASCVSLTEAVFPVLEKLGNHAFDNCSALKKIDCPELTSVGSLVSRTDIFAVCHALETVNMPNVEYVGAYVFQEAYALKEVHVENALKVGESAFSVCSSLTTLEFSDLREVSANAFVSSGLTTLIIRSEDLSVFDTSALTGTPIAAKKGFIYVPDDSVDMYKTAYFSAYADQVKGISELPTTEIEKMSAEA